MHPFRLCSLPLLLWLLAVTAQAAPVPTAPKQPAPAKPMLTVLAIGVSQHRDPANNLQFPAKDAAALANLFRAQEGKLFGKVVVTMLTDKAATRDAILRSLVALRKGAAQMGPNDCVVLFASGHGVNDDLGQYLFAPYDINAASIDVTGVPWVSFAQTITRLPGHVLVLLDTSHAEEGAVGIPNAAVLAACGKGELSEESTDWNGGAFARTLADGLGGAADGNHNGVVTLTELVDYARQHVPELTKQAQTPVFVRPAAFPADLPLATVTPAHSSHFRIVPIP